MSDMAAVFNKFLNSRTHGEPRKVNSRDFSFLTAAWRQKHIDYFQARYNFFASARRASGRPARAVAAARMAKRRAGDIWVG